MCPAPSTNNHILLCCVWWWNRFRDILRLWRMWYTCVYLPFVYYYIYNIHMHTAFIIDIDYCIYSCSNINIAIGYKTIMINILSKLMIFGIKWRRKSENERPRPGKLHRTHMLAHTNNVIQIDERFVLLFDLPGNNRRLINICTSTIKRPMNVWVLDTL